MIEHNIDHHIPLDQPQRQSPLAIAFILVKFLRQAARRFWPLILIIVFQQGDSYMAWLLGSLLVISCVQLVLSLISYYKYYFHIKDGELIIQKGVLRKTNLNIPLDRIQTINFQQNVLHQLLGVVSVEVDTAGSAKAELNIDALSRPKAEELRDYILQKKKELIEEKEEAEPLLNEDGEVIEVEKTPVISSVPDRKVFELSPIDLFKVGVSGNHIRTFFLLIGSIFGLLQFTGLSEDEVWELVVTEAIGFQETYGWILIMGGDHCYAGFRLPFYPNTDSTQIFWYEAMGNRKRLQIDCWLIQPKRAICFASKDSDNPVVYRPFKKDFWPLHS